MKGGRISVRVCMLSVHNMPVCVPETLNKRIIPSLSALRRWIRIIRYRHRDADGDAHINSLFNYPPAVKSNDLTLLWQFIGELEAGVRRCWCCNVTLTDGQLCIQMGCFTLWTSTVSDASPCHSIAARSHSASSRTHTFTFVRSRERGDNYCVFFTQLAEYTRYICGFCGRGGRLTPSYRLGSVMEQ